MILITMVIYFSSLHNKTQSNKKSMLQSLNINKLHSVKFPDDQHFAESFSIDKNLIYFPLNGGTRNNNGLYQYNMTTNVFQLICPFPRGSVVLGSRLLDSMNWWIGADTANCGLIIINLNTCKILKRIPVFHTVPFLILFRNRIRHYVNDLTIDTSDQNMCYVISNVNYQSRNGILTRVNLQTGAVTVLLDDIISGTGINMIGDDLFISTLSYIIKYNPRTAQRQVMDMNLPTNPFFDNITINFDSSKLHIAIFSYGNKIEEVVLENQACSCCGNYVMSATLGSAYYDITNTDRSMAENKIQFIEYDLQTGLSTVLEFSTTINNFDACVTQIREIMPRTFIAVNWKANKFVILS